MLNPVPIQFLALFAYFILRISVCIVLLLLIRRQLPKRTTYPQLVQLLVVAELMIFGLLLLGLYTQYAALGLAVLSISALFLKQKYTELLHVPRTSAVLLLGISLALFITGAGVFAVDLPI